ncbi:helix-turn-helix domain-containing protein [Pedobacter sp. ASV12]|uniref:helix-turn-helix domain-containing protein n=1 Tax=Pedobacter sp. ASV12 TaxID=2795120 RepID=UPI0018EB037E|nr:helix-turn-helix transcriptional regulator [Pedobacter sp. ASV12]
MPLESKQPKINELKIIRHAALLSANEMKAFKPHKINSFRTEKKYSQAFMAYKLGLSLGSYQKLESGETKISLFQLIQIAIALEKLPQDFL